MNETEKEAAWRLSEGARDEGFKPEALHVYTAADGTPIYYRIRLKHPDTGAKWIRPMWLKDGRFVLGEPPFQNSKPLYHLHELAQRSGKPVIVVEGERCADALAKLGILATTSGAADSAGKADWSPLAGRAVTIWRDNDEPGARLQVEATAKLMALGCTVRWLDVDRLGLPPKGDCVDWLSGHPEAKASDVWRLTCVETTAASVGESAPSPTDTGDVALSRLAALPSLTYAEVRKAEAKRLGVTVTALDSAVREFRRDKTRDSAVGGMFPVVEPWPASVYGAALLSDLLAAIQTFIVCDSETAIAAVLWIAFTWFIDEVQVAPLAVITAPEKRCGKTQLLSLFARLVRRRLSASNLTPASVFRVIERDGPTLLIDEADTFLRENDELRGVINSGHTRDTAFVIRTVGDDHEPRQFSTWGAKALCCIGDLPDTLTDRAIVLRLRRKLPGEKVQRLRHADPVLFQSLASKLLRYSEDTGPAIAAARPDLPAALTSDRAQDNWEPLLAIADHAGGEWPALARAAALKLNGADEEPASVRVELLLDVRAVFDATGADRLPSAELLRALTADELRRWATYNRGKPMTLRQLARFLSEFGARPGTVRVGSETSKGYKRADLEDAFARYLAPKGASVTASQSDDSPLGTAGSSVTGAAPRSGAPTAPVTRNEATFQRCDVVTADRRTQATARVEGIEDREERAAIMEYEGGLSRDEAERLAGIRRPLHAG